MAKNKRTRLPTVEEFKNYHVKDTSVPDMWMPASRADGKEGEWVQIASETHPIYRSHIDVFGVPEWGSTNTPQGFRPITFFYAKIHPVIDQADVVKIKITRAVTWK